MTWPLGLNSSKKALISKPISNEGRKEARTSASIQRRQRQPLSVHLWTYSTHPTQDVNDVWRLATPQGSMSSTLFEQWCEFFYVPQEPDECKCSETGPTVFPRGVLRPEVQPLTLLHTIFGEKGSPFVHLLLTNWYPLSHISFRTLQLF